MLSTPLHVSIPLHLRPEAVFIGVGIHGPNRTERHQLLGNWALHIYRYHGTVTVQQHDLPIRPGHVSLIPPGVETVYTFPHRSEHLCAHFHFAQTTELAPAVTVPAMQDLGQDFVAVNRALEDASRAFSMNPTRADVRLWDVLWQIADRTPLGTVEVHAHPPCVVRARAIIELHLNEPLTVRDLAAAVHVSHNHLTRQFRASLGMTVVAYIRKRRVERARHLLHNTTLPIRIIAEQVGIPDARLFSRVIRTSLGHAPTEIRRRPP
ncbi:AraC family transcriptional regulator [Deinococcus sonorensis]|uniref:AraC family transcriptional regulator n=1 Tax=Deinococcus sonorensis KR-87 TaxID=694439 RepID=A0AAU7UFB4_9DEIO